MKKRLTRRSFLTGAGGVAVGLPFLDAMLAPRKTHAQDPIPKRVVFFFTANGPNPERWWPTSGGERDFTLNSSMEPLAPFRDKLLILDNMPMLTARERRGDGGNGHDVGTAHCLTAMPIVAGPMGTGEFGHLWDGTAGGISIDQKIGNHFDGVTRYRSLEFGVRAQGISQALPSRISYRGRGEAVVPMHTPQQAFDRVFQPLTADVAAQARVRRRRELVLAAVQGDLGRLRPRLGTADRFRVDSHIASIGDIARRVDDLSANVCDLPPRTEAGENAYEQLADLQADLIPHAFKCDLTRVASIQYANGQSGVRHTWLGHDDYHHSISHKGDSDANARRQVSEIDRWHCQKFARLLAGLQAVDTGDGQTLLDHTTVVWVNEQEKGTGNTHRWNRMPYVLAGSGGGFFNTGRYLDMGGRGHADMFVSVMQMMGMPDTTFGVRDLCMGPVTSLHA